MNNIRVALFSTRAKAEPVQRRLVEAGIAAEIAEEPPHGRLWFVSKPSGGVRVEVPTKEFEKAYQLLIDWDRAEGLPAIHCPDCGSLRVDYPQFTRKSMLTNVAMGFMAMVGVILKEFYCEDCHYTWPKQGQKRSRAKPNMAPHYFMEGVPTNPHGKR